MPLGDRLKSAWNAFMNKDPTYSFKDLGMSYGYRPDRVRLSRGNDRSIATAVYNRIAMDAATLEIRHVRLNESNQFIENMDSNLNECLTTSANIDQTGRSLIQDIVLSMLDEGCVAVVPVDTDRDPFDHNSFDVITLRTGKIVQWYPEKVKVRLYNERSGHQEEIIVPKKSTAIIENPLYAVINEPNSTMQRLVRKLALLDVIDDQKGAGKLDLIIQLPYIIKSDARRAQAEMRRKDIEMQLNNSKYGIAYTDGTEHITQLNRSVDNQLQNQIEYLTSMLYSQLGISAEIMNGTANDETMNNYYNRTIEPILSAIVEEMRRKFLTKTARTQRQSIIFFRDPFKLMPISKYADLANSLIRNEVLTSNEFRQKIGMQPSDDPKADQLNNPNMPSDTDGDGIPDVPEEPMTEEDYNAKMAQLEEFDKQIEELEKMAGGGEDDDSE